MALGVFGIIVAAVAACTCSSPLLAYFIKFFNIIDIMSNLDSLNVEFGPRFSLVMKFIENLKVLELDFLVRMSPLHDSNFDSPDVDAYQITTRGTRGKMTGSNEDVFIINGANFAISMMIIGVWVLRRILRVCLDESNGIISLLSFVYQTLIGVMFFDFQMISSTEIAFFDYSRLFSSQSKYLGSLLLSVVILILILDDFFEGFCLIEEKMKIEEKIEKVEKSERLSTNDEIVLDKYTEGINMESEGTHNYLGLILNLRFFIIQIAISALQLLNRTQAMVVFMINLTYFVFFIRIVCSSTLFTSKLMLIKEYFQEGCILLVLVTITIFSFTEKSSFSTSTGYMILEIMAAGSIIGAAGSELVMILSALCESLTECLKTKKEVVSILSKAAKDKESGVYKADSLSELKPESKKMILSPRKKITLKDKIDQENKISSSWKFGYNPFNKTTFDKIEEGNDPKSRKERSDVLPAQKVNAFAKRSSYKKGMIGQRAKFGAGNPRRMKARKSRSTVFWNFNEKEEGQHKFNK